MWAWSGYECGGLGVPVKDASGDFGMMWPGADQGQWFKGGAIVRIYGSWQIKWGNYGQYAGRLVEGVQAIDGLEDGLLSEKEPPPLTDDMKAADREEVK